MGVKQRIHFSGALLSCHSGLSCVPCPSAGWQTSEPTSNWVGAASLPHPQQELSRRGGRAIDLFIYLSITLSMYMYSFFLCIIRIYIYIRIYPSMSTVVYSF